MSWKKAKDRACGVWERCLPSMVTGSVMSAHKKSGCGSVFVMDSDSAPAVPYCPNSVYKL